MFEDVELIKIDQNCVSEYLTFYLISPKENEVSIMNLCELIDMSFKINNWRGEDRNTHHKPKNIMLPSYVWLLLNLVDNNNALFQEMVKNKDIIPIRNL